VISNEYSELINYNTNKLEKHSESADLCQAYWFNTKF